MDDAKIRSFVLGMQQVAREPSAQQRVRFETLLQDFVIELKQFSNKDLARMNYIKVCGCWCCVCTALTMAIVILPLPRDRLAT